MVVIHYTAMQSAQAACDALCNPANEVSAHYLIAEDGSVAQMVAEDQRAWHAGAGRWGCVEDVNSRSIGIELANTGITPFSAPLMDALENLLRGIMDRWAIRPERVIGHSDMAPGRKIDPGPRFDWQRLWRGGLAVWPDQQISRPEISFRRAMQTFGYTAQVADDILLEALRLRFRPQTTGPLDATDLAIIGDLARRFPVDAGPATA